MNNEFPIKSRKIDIAVVGCGRISGKHFEAINTYKDDLNLCAICDNDPKVLNNINITGARKFLKLDELLSSFPLGLDLVTLCTPSGLHSEQSILASKYAGVNVITEKPMATRWNDGIKMVKEFDNNESKLFVVKQNRNNPPLVLLKKAIDENRFRKIYLVQINVFWTRPQSYYDSAKWRGTWELDGGALMNQASHYIDMLHYLFGPVQDISAMTGTLARNIEVEDTGVLNIRWRNGSIGSMAITMLTYPKNFEGSITVIGEKGTVRLGGVAINKIEEWTFSDEQPYDSEIKNLNYTPTNVYGNGHIGYYKNVIDVMRGKCEPQTDGREGLKSLEIIIAAYLSARDKKRISLPLEY